MTTKKKLPGHVTLTEVGPRDGFQSEVAILSTETKVSVINALVEAGIRDVQVASFVHPKWVPQMADAEAVCQALAVDSNATYVGLALNSRGVQRAFASGIRHIELSIATTETQSRKNANMSLDESVAELFEMIELCHDFDMHIRAGLQCVWGCHEEQHSDSEFLCTLARDICKAGVEALSLADSIGAGNPVSVADTVSRIQDVVGSTPLILHLHDTRGLALANVVAALELGVTRFDTSVAGMGGCPFLPGATGNVATGDVAYMLESMGVETGIDLPKLADVADMLQKIYSRTFPGTVQRLIREHGPESLGLV